MQGVLLVESKFTHHSVLVSKGKEKGVSMREGDRLMRRYFYLVSQFMPLGI